MRHVPFERRHKKRRAKCPFCKTAIAKPKRFGGSTGPSTLSAEIRGGRCDCGSVYIVDAGGKAGGEAVVEGLTLLCDGDNDRAMGLTSGVDYRLIRRAYSPRTHTMEPRLRGRGGFKQPKMWFLRLIEPPEESES